MIRTATVAAAMLALPTVAHAQAYSCSVPASVPTPHADLPNSDEPVRVLPTGGYTLAITWSPEYCHGHAQDAGSRFECAAGNRFGFTLHGLWPDGQSKAWPEYCHPTGILPPAVIGAHLCAVPSAQLIQHEWAKHGTCTADSPAAFFARSRALYGRLHYPDMDALSRHPLTVDGFRQAMAAANPGMTPEMMRVSANKRGWLEEVWLCLGKDYQPRACPAFESGAAGDTQLHIWRGGHDGSNAGYSRYRQSQRDRSSRD